MARFIVLLNSVPFVLWLCVRVLCLFLSGFLAIFLFSFFIW